MKHSPSNQRAALFMRSFRVFALIAVLATANSVGAGPSDTEVNQRRKTAAKELLSQIAAWSKKNGCLPEISSAGVKCSKTKNSSGAIRLSIDGGVTFQKYLESFSHDDPTTGKPYTQVNLPVPPKPSSASPPSLSTDQIFVASGLSCTKKSDGYTTSKDPDHLVAVYRLNPVSKVHLGCVALGE